MLFLIDLLRLRTDHSRPMSTRLFTLGTAGWRVLCLHRAYGAMQPSLTLPNRPVPPALPAALIRLVGNLLNNFYIIHVRLIIILDCYNTNCVFMRIYCGLLLPFIYTYLFAGTERYATICCCVVLIPHFRAYPEVYLFDFLSHDTDTYHVYMQMS